MKVKVSTTYEAVFHHNADDGSYTVLFPDLPGCITEGKSLDEAVAMAQSALDEWLAYFSETGQPLPEPRYTSRTADFPNLFAAGKQF